MVQALGGRGPNQRAAELIGGTRLTDVQERKRLAEAGLDGIGKSTDPLIQLAREMEPELRRLRQIEEELAEIERQAYAQIADAQFALQGTDVYPDATFTLRLAFGPVKGYVEDGRRVPPWTTLGGAFEHEQRHGAKSPWKLPSRWRDGQHELNAATPFNFVCTADIIGGNSGSPVINRKAELVGVIFDGNIQSLTADYFYSDEIARAVAVHSSALLETLRKIYGAAHLADELGH